MKMKDGCLPCVVNQVIKVADITDAKEREKLYRHAFAYLSTMDFEKTIPENMGEIFDMLKKHIGNEDPYKEIRRFYNELLLGVSGQFEERINRAEDQFMQAMKYAVLGNIIDFGPMHDITMDDVMSLFDASDGLEFKISQAAGLREDISKASSLLYLGDNCGEICLDKLFIKYIKKQNPEIKIYFGVRGKPVLNDSIEEDAYFVGMDEYARIISNGDGSVGTVLERTSGEFNRIFGEADVILAKGQANYECLSEYRGKKIYFLLMAKCRAIAEDIGVEEKALICMSNMSAG